MKIVQTIKDYFAPAYSKRFANPVEDICVLGNLCSNSLYLTANNGKGYYYFFPKTPSQIKVAKYLFNRNGVPVKIHYSKYYMGVQTKVLRIQNKQMAADKKVQDFVYNVDMAAKNSASFTKQQLAEKLVLLNKQMNGKSK